jgi:translation initiation factor IF-3
MEMPVRPADLARINDAIRAPQVRLIDEDGTQIGVKKTDEAR